MLVRMTRVSIYWEVEAEEVVEGAGSERGEFKNWMELFNSTSREFEPEEEGVTFHSSLS